MLEFQVAQWVTLYSVCKHLRAEKLIIIVFGLLVAIEVQIDRDPGSLGMLEKVCRSAPEATATSIVAEAASSRRSESSLLLLSGVLLVCSRSESSSGLCYH